MIVPCGRAVKSTAKNARELRSGRAVSLLFFPATVLPEITRVLFSLGLFYFRDAPSLSVWHKLFFLT